MYMELCRFIYGKKNILIVDHSLAYKTKPNHTWTKRNQARPYKTTPDRAL